MVEQNQEIAKVEPPALVALAMSVSHRESLEVVAACFEVLPKMVVLPKMAGLPKMMVAAEQ